MSACFTLKIHSYCVRVVGGLGSVGKKTTLLQAEVSACVSELANVLFCVSAIFIFLFCLYVANCPLLSVFLHLAVTVCKLPKAGRFRTHFATKNESLITHFPVPRSTAPPLAAICCYGLVFCQFTKLVTEKGHMPSIVI